MAISLYSKENPSLKVNQFAILNTLYNAMTFHHRRQKNKTSKSKVKKTRFRSLGSKFFYYCACRWRLFYERPLAPWRVNFFDGDVNTRFMVREDAKRSSGKLFQKTLNLTNHYEKNCHIKTSATKTPSPPNVYSAFSVASLSLDGSP